MKTKTLSKVVIVDGEESTLGDIAQGLEEAVNAAIEEIEGDGGEILGPVTLAPASARYSEPVEGSYRDRGVSENGHIAVITYRLQV